MADIELFIKISEETYDVIKSDLYNTFPAEMKEAIKNGAPLPKGHGELIDRNEIEYLKAIHDLKWGRITANECARKIKYSAPTIIDADTESE